MLGEVVVMVGVVVELASVWTGAVVVVIGASFAVVCVVGAGVVVVFAVESCVLLTVMVLGECEG